jgi:hypothetical protein
MKGRHTSRRPISRLRFAALAALVALGTTPVRAADPAVAELVEMFVGVCLGRFPDDAAVRQFTTEKGLAVMPDERLHHLLGTDPGQGWIQNTARGQYVLTLEMPPYHTCAIRKGDSAAPDFLATFSEALATWAAKQPGASLKQQPVRTAQISGSPAQIYPWYLDRGPGKQAETLMAIVTNATSSVEVRLARAIKVQ